MTVDTRKCPSSASWLLCRMVSWLPLLYSRHKSFSDARRTTTLKTIVRANDKHILRPHILHLSRSQHTRPVEARLSESEMMRVPHASNFVERLHGHFLALTVTKPEPAIFMTISSLMNLPRIVRGVSRSHSPQTVPRPISVRARPWSPIQAPISM